MIEIFFYLSVTGYCAWSAWKITKSHDRIRELRHQLADCRYEKDTLEMHLKKAIDRIEELENRLTQE